MKKSELKQMIKCPESFTPVNPENIFQKAPLILLEDIQRCFVVLKSFSEGQLFEGERINSEEVDKTYDFLEKGVFPYILKERSLYQQLHKEVPEEMLSILSQYKKLKSSCNTKRSLN